jgi:PAS domain-containing protein
MPVSHHALHAPVSLPDDSIAAAGQELAESAWIDVIQRMDEVYSELVASQETLETKHRELAEAHHFTEGVLAAMTDVLIVCDTVGKVRQVNRAMLQLTGRTESAGRLRSDRAGGGQPGPAADCQHAGGRPQRCAGCGNRAAPPAGRAGTGYLECQPAV